MIEQLLNVGERITKDLLSKTWQKVGPVGLFNMQHTSAVVDGDVYILGGRVGESATARNGNTRYRAGVLTSMANLPVAIVAGCAAAIGRKIYLMCGCTAIISGYQNKKLYVYDVDTNTYTVETDAPFTSVVGSCVAIGTNIYVYGGMNDQNEASFPKLFYKYDTETGTLTAKAAPPQAISARHQFVNYKGWLVMMFGCLDTIWNPNPICYRYHPGLNKWEQWAPNPTLSRSFAGCVVRDSNIYLLSGYSGSAGLSDSIVMRPT